jgi:hypothetical protein
MENHCIWIEHHVNLLSRYAEFSNFSSNDSVRLPDIWWISEEIISLKGREFLNLGSLGLGGIISRTVVALRFWRSQIAARSCNPTTCESVCLASKSWENIRRSKCATGRRWSPQQRLSKATTTQPGLSKTWGYTKMISDVFRCIGKSWENATNYDKLWETKINQDRPCDLGAPDFHTNPAGYLRYWQPTASQWPGGWTPVAQPHTKTPKANV